MANKNSQVKDTTNPPTNTGNQSRIIINTNKKVRKVENVNKVTNNEIKISFPLLIPSLKNNQV